MLACITDCICITIHAQFVSLGKTVISIGLDENNVYWTNGSVISFVNHVTSDSSPTVFSTLDENVISLHSLSPARQPQYCKYGYIYICK